jgi:hypothetical protein
MSKQTLAAIRSTATGDLQAKLNLLLGIEQPTQGQSEMAEAIIEELASRIVEVAL